MGEEWKDKKAEQLYLVAIGNYYDNIRSDAVKSLGKLAREGSSDAAWALGAIARGNYYDWLRTMAIKELGQT